MKKPSTHKIIIDYILELRALGQKKVSSTEIANHLEISQQEASELLAQIVAGDTFTDARLESAKSSRNEIIFTK